MEFGKWLTSSKLSVNWLSVNWLSVNCLSVNYYGLLITQDCVLGKTKSKCLNNPKIFLGIRV